MFHPSLLILVARCFLSGEVISDEPLIELQVIFSKDAFDFSYDKFQ